MNKAIIPKVLKYEWHPWLRRNFHAFMMSLFEGSSSRETFKRIGLDGWELKSFTFADSTWYWSDEVFNQTVPVLRKWLKNHHVSEISERLEIFHVKSLKRVAKLSIDPEKDTKNKLIELAGILRLNCAYIWSTHMLEHVIWADLKSETKKYIRTNMDKYIGDASYPIKKNCLELMEDEMRQGVDLKAIRRKYSWMRTRDGFTRPYSLQELAAHRAQLKKRKPHIYPFVPGPLVKLYDEARELVFLRTRRTDIFYQYIFMARPLLRTVARRYGLSFSELRYYTLQSLIAGKPKRYSDDMTCLAYENEMYITDDKIFSGSIIHISSDELKGAIAQPGKARGAVKIVLKIADLPKVKKGDILVTYMTSPDFLQAMKLSAAFITNEGGLTCHAAIIAREMKKPCIIGTKIATRVLHDGDLVEVDADKGVVKIIKKK